MSKRRISIGIFIIFIILCGAFLLFGRREIATVHNPSDDNYYIKVYQIGYMYTTHYHCVSILYGPDGEISREYFEAFSTDQGEPRYMREGQSIEIEWHDDCVSVSSTDRGCYGTTRKFYIDGRISLETCMWDVDW
ncbi:hypothetical protein SAMN02745229_02543 [Butyrivibrio fibrisolvens DSM 3071]|uniref:Uncharacterized protein n=1 Tax=Butyrivibrio fibrisolvens DSM 3071 TaxID=1121131 RepID=A0A1M5ZPC5_BUTFI|nr:hypothetical protein [Butyrivibrio fibrisolvens]SHI26235.1 hypothetical protein SAMN02745229_02543 [Butyrivibrio fibrisolvens DSM 3071]